MTTLTGSAGEIAQRLDALARAGLRNLSIRGAAAAHA
jgi:hypothetical protein